MATPTPRFRDGDRVIVNTGGNDHPATVEERTPPNDSIDVRTNVCVRFESGRPPQWVPVRYVRAVDTRADETDRAELWRKTGEGPY